jgi:hypothetical protein
MSPDCLVSQSQQIALDSAQWAKQDHKKSETKFHSAHDHQSGFGDDFVQSWLPQKLQTRALTAAVQ